MTYEEFVKLGGMAIRNFPCETGDFLADLLVARSTSGDDLRRNLEGWLMTWKGIRQDEASEIFRYIRCEVLTHTFAPLNCKLATVKS